ncbi:MAG: shikimate kinase [Thermoplasmata archaeon]|nr:shikimate kinase [Thermoplasmata archaeon]
MRGVGSAGGAVTIVNSLSTGVGCALGIERSVVAEVELESAPSGGVSRWEIEPQSDSPLARAALAAGLERFSNGSGFTGSLKVRSDIPVAKGLKSSSAVSVAILRAVADALGRRVTETEVSRLSADASTAAGVSATGAFDDALACAGGGLVLTDNDRRHAMRRVDWAHSLRAVVWVPEPVHPPFAGYRERFAAFRSEGDLAVSAARSGDYSTAMGLNGALVERVMGYDYSSLRGRLLDAGAVTTGVTGMGPALVALASERLAERVRSVMPEAGTRWVADLRPLSPESQPEEGG